MDKHTVSEILKFLREKEATVSHAPMISYGLAHRLIRLEMEEFIRGHSPKAETL